MKRLHLHISVDDLNRSLHFYQTLFGVVPAVLKTVYAKWMLDDPPVNFAISQRNTKVGLDHIGIQTDSDDELSEMKARMETAELETLTQLATTCCYAKSDKHWTRDPSGIAWETFHTLEDAPTFTDTANSKASDAACCAPTQHIQFLKSKGKSNLGNESSCC